MIIVVKRSLALTWHDRTRVVAHFARGLGVAPAQTRTADDAHSSKDDGETWASPFRHGRQPIDGRAESRARRQRREPRVVERGVRVDPVRLGIDVQIEHLRDVRPLEQRLLPRDQCAMQRRLRLIEMEQLAGARRGPCRDSRERTSSGQLSTTVRSRSPPRSPRCSASPGSSRRCACARSSAPR